MTDTTTTETGAATGGVRTLLRLEGLVLFVGMTVLYYKWEGSWLIYVLLFLVPDLSFDDARFCRRRAAGALDCDDLACPYRDRPCARLRTEIFQRLRLHPSRADRESERAGVATRHCLESVVRGTALQAGAAQISRC